MRYRYIDSPIGELLLAGEQTLRLLGFPDGNKARRADPDWRKDSACFADVETQLGEYFAGERERFELSLEMVGTPFQKSVWQALTTIPYGQTCTYKDIAERIDRPKAMRAVGAANGNNPIPVIVPCHRVIGASGKLTGFGGGLPTKAYLLDLERGTPGLSL